jgi:phenylalanyl-tRNA synthetase beta chain
VRAPLSWLCDYADFGDVPVEELASTLSELGLVVEGVARVGAGLDSVVVAEILDIRPVPSADRVRLVEVDAGLGRPVAVVCGAWNMGVGDLVPLAPVGTVLPAGNEIGRRIFRGQVSEGMLCSPGELELPAPEGSDGLLILPAGIAAPGTPIAQALELTPDVVFDLDISPNRPDALCVAGVARDLAAALHRPWAAPAQVELDVDPTVIPPPLVVEATELCPRFTATPLEGVAPATSPAWLARRLTLAGMRPINHVVDVSNYVMLDLGQPNHPYDRARLGGGGLLVRRARPGERLTTLDGVERVLTTDDCVIADAGSVGVGVAGIMGGAASEIGDDTAAVVLEAAWFEPMAVARTGKRLGLLTEARTRFERGVDPEITRNSVERFVALLAEHQPGIRRGATVERLDRSHLPSPSTITVRRDRVNAILGTTLGDDDIAGLLQPIGFGLRADPNGAHEVTVPTWRPDTTREIDAIEEVARLWGYRRIERTSPSAPRSGGGLTIFQRERRRVRDVMVGTGTNEAWTTTFLAPGDLERAGLSPEAVEVENPLDRNESILRPSLLPGLIKAVRFNVDHQEPAVRLFEIGRVFAPPSGGRSTPDEREELAAVANGPGIDARWAARLWTVLADAMRLEGTTIEAAAVDGLHPTRAAAIRGADGSAIGAIGEIDPEVLADFGVPGRVAYLEADLELLVAQPRRPGTAAPVSRYPASDLDLAFVVAEDVPAAVVQATLRDAAGDLAEHVRLFDVYRGPQLGSQRRSLAFRVRLRASDRTLTDAELAQVRAGLIDTLARAHGAELRS